MKRLCSSASFWATRFSYMACTKTRQWASVSSASESGMRRVVSICASRRDACSRQADRFSLASRAEDWAVLTAVMGHKIPTNLPVPVRLEYECIQKGMNQHHTYIRKHQVTCRRGRSVYLSSTTLSRICFSFWWRDMWRVGRSYCAICRHTCQKDAGGRVA